mmetsp:Transcript_34624/g.80859  ORF Transcript_34624/g.80859 Transcript_34624/m.80859 type:complete len:422 (-) Transcript_34624:52-1317(-)|eukprot:CAMPEP_0178391868 /NCGR_PEP_ID=MMETSP0689_2-20121128/11385_1 /TAXON_ID=160604 /ORGANISM="Amphidinium massartii, Strain CS-259" /LENGTH=421 /DNA_ID=CAMNT_0020012425 /DNA_START=118 /DNA_END=1383 /DNA_ORIENTATION=-
MQPAPQYTTAARTVVPATTTTTASPVVTKVATLTASSTPTAAAVAAAAPTRVVQPAAAPATVAPVSTLTSAPRIVQASPTVISATAGTSTAAGSAPVVRRVAAAPAPTAATTLTQVPVAATAGGVRTVGSTPTLSASVRTVPATTAVGTGPVTVTTRQSVPLTPSIKTASNATPTVIRKVAATTAVAGPTSSLGPQVPETSQHPAAGPGLTQGVYEQKHQDDPKLTNLRELRKTSGLKEIPVGVGLKGLKAYADDGKLSREAFLKGYEELLTSQGAEVPSVDVRNAVFDLFDRDDNNIVDMMELICGISLLCAGSEEEKIHAIFEIFDENGDNYISMDEMYKFLTSVFNVVLTPQVMGVMNSMGVRVDSAEDLASVTALECFKQADLNHDGKLSVEEFKSWFYAPRNDPSFLFSPVRKLLQ